MCPLKSLSSKAIVRVSLRLLQSPNKKVLTDPILVVRPELHRMRTDTPRIDRISLPPLIFRLLLPCRGGKVHTGHSGKVGGPKDIKRCEDLAYSLSEPDVQT